MIIQGKRKTLTLALILAFVFTVNVLSLNSTIGSGIQSGNEELCNGNLINIDDQKIYTPESSNLPIDTDEIMPVGNITVNSILDVGTHSFYVENDIGTTIQEELTGVIKPSYTGFDFMGVSKIASDATAVFADLTYTDYITLKINETAKFDYWYNNSRAIASFKSNISDDSVLTRMTVNGSDVNLNDDTKFNITGGGYILNFSSYRPNVQYPNGTLIMGYELEYNLTIGYWRIWGFDKPYYNNYFEYIEDATSEVKTFFNYTFEPQHDNTGLNVNFSINIPDVNHLSEFAIAKLTHSQILNEGENIPIDGNNKLLPNKSFQMIVDGEDFESYERFCISFSSVFTLEFKNRHCSFWSKDYLYSSNNVRKREYELSCIDGPSSLFASYFSFNESTLPYGDVISVSSIFGRETTHYDMNTSVEVGGKLGTTLFTIGYLKDHPYYLVLGETDIITFTYRCEKTLKLLLLDQINTPIEGVEVILYYGDVVWGTMMSNDKAYPIAVKVSDSTGQISIPDLGYGNYSIQVVYGNEIVMNVSVNQDLILNIINTPIPHFPIWVLTYSLIFVIIGGLGFFIYTKNTKSR